MWVCFGICVYHSTDWIPPLRHAISRNSSIKNYWKYKSIERFFEMKSLCFKWNEWILFSGTKTSDLLMCWFSVTVCNWCIFTPFWFQVPFATIPANCEREKGSVKPKFATNNIEKKKHGNHSERHQMCMQFVLLVFIMKRTSATASPSFFNTNKMPKKTKGRTHQHTTYI